MIDPNQTELTQARDPDEQGREVTFISRPSEALPQPVSAGWAKPPTIFTLKADLAASKPYHDQVVQKVQEWRDHRDCTGGAAPKKVKGRSSVAPKLIRKHNEWRYPSLSEPFLGQEKIFEVRPRSWEDRKAARQQEKLLNHQFDTVIDKVQFIDDLVRAAVDDGTVAIELGWSQVQKTRTVTVPVYAYYPVPDHEEEVLQQLEQAFQMKQENYNAFRDLPEEVQAAVNESEVQQMPVTAMVTGYQEVEESYFEKNCPTAEVCDLANLYFDPSCNGILDKAMFGIRSFETNYGELKAAGIYQNLELVPWEELTLHGETDHTSKTPVEFQMEGKARNKVVAYRYYGFQDVHGTGELVSIVVTWIGDTIIQMEETPFPDKKVPFVLGRLMPKRGYLYGEPDAELLIENQQTIGAITRGIIDLMARSANAQQGVPKGFLDIPNKRRFEEGRDYEYNPMLGRPDQQLVQHQFPQIPQSALEMIAINAQEAGSLTGVQTFNEGVNGEAYGQVAAGVRGVLAASSKRETSILRRLAKVVAEVGTKISQMNMAFLSEEEVIRVTNEKFEVVRRDEIQGRYDIIVDVSSAEADAAKSQKLAFMLQTIGPSVDFSVTKIIMAEIAYLDGMDELAHSIEAYEPQPNPMAVAIQEAELAELQAKAAKLQADAEETLARAEYYRAAARNMGSKADQADLDFVEQETGTKHARDMQKIQSQAESNQDLEVTRAILKEEGENPGPRLPRLNQAVMWNAVSRNR